MSFFLFLWGRRASSMQKSIFPTSDDGSKIDIISRFFETSRDGRRRRNTLPPSLPPFPYGIFFILIGFFLLFVRFFSGKSFIHRPPTLQMRASYSFAMFGLFLFILVFWVFWANGFLMWEMCGRRRCVLVDKLFRMCAVCVCVCMCVLGV